MEERRKSKRYETLQRGRIILNGTGSYVDCTIRNLSTEGACISLASPAAIPETFDLLLEGNEPDLHCTLIWQTGDRIGVSLEPLRHEASRHRRLIAMPGVSLPTDLPATFNPGTMLRLMAALDEIKTGIVLLDNELRAEFINRAFRTMWRLPDIAADSNPSFVSLLHHGRDTQAYDVPDDKLETYIAERVREVRTGNPAPRDLRLSSGEAVRTQCATLPSGGRMLTYTYVTDIVQYVDRLEVLRSALDNVDQGVVLLDPDLNAQFLNRAVRKLWHVKDDFAALQPPFANLLNDTRVSRVYGVPDDQIDDFIAKRIHTVSSGETHPIDLPAAQGRSIRSQCAVLPGGGRMITYTDVTDLIRNADELRRLATTDSMTGLFNRRHFQQVADNEWSRFQRYHRPLSLLVTDIDRFKSINDQNGHNVGDAAIVHVAGLLRRALRSSDVLARVGGDEFVVLMPETDLRQAATLAERLRYLVMRNPLVCDQNSIPISLSIGAAQATLGMSDFQVLVNRADQALYRAKENGRNQVATSAPIPVPDHDTAAE